MTLVQKMRSLVAVTRGWVAAKKAHHGSQKAVEQGFITSSKLADEPVDTPYDGLAPKGSPIHGYVRGWSRGAAYYEKKDEKAASTSLTSEEG